MTRLSDGENFFEFCHLEGFKTHTNNKCSKIRKISGLKIDLKAFGFLLYIFFWVIPWRLNFICRRFETLCLFHLHRLVV